MERIAVFMDYGNVHMLGHDLFGHSIDKRETYVNPRRVADRVLRMRRDPSELAGVFVFRGEPCKFRDPEATRIFRKQKYSWAVDPLVTATYLPLRYQDNRRPPKETGVDVRMSLNLVKAAQSGVYDTIVVFTGDGDCFPGIEDASQTKTHIEVTAWTSGTGFKGNLATALAVNRLGLRCHRLDDTDFWACQDLPKTAAA
ncbi:NYN domain-containing protein [Arthrobacter sp. MDT1-48-3]